MAQHQHSITCQDQFQSLGCQIHLTLGILKSMASFNIFQVLKLLFCRPSPSPAPTPTPAQTPNSPATPNRKVSTKWDSNGVNGGKTSMDVLLTWLMKEGNYSRYKGGHGHKGEKKDTILSPIVALLHAEGLTH
jgi:hypothetical protein